MHTSKYQLHTIVDRIFHLVLEGVLCDSGGIHEHRILGHHAVSGRGQSASHIIRSGAGCDSEVADIIHVEARGGGHGLKDGQFDGEVVVFRIQKICGVGDASDGLQCRASNNKEC